MQKNENKGLGILGIAIIALVSMISTMALSGLVALSSYIFYNIFFLSIRMVVYLTIAVSLLAVFIFCKISNLIGLW
jgi:hypothetical protein